MNRHSRPIIEEIEGREQDNRQAIASAFRRMCHRRNRYQATDLHVRELLFYVMATDRDGRGVQKSYDELSDVLCVTRGMARKIVQRANEEFGLLAIIEDRYASGGQTANRYQIDWPVVRAVNAGRLDKRPARFEEIHSDELQHHAAPGVPIVHGGAPMVQGGVPIVHGGVPMVHPYKEYTRTSPELFQNSSSSSEPPDGYDDETQDEGEEEFVFDSDPEPLADASDDEWEPITRELLAEGVATAADAIDGAKSAGITPDEVRAIVEHWRGLVQADAKRFKAPPYALLLRIRNHRPGAPIDVGWLGQSGSGPHAVALPRKPNAIVDEQRFVIDVRRAAIADGKRGEELQRVVDAAVAAWRRKRDEVRDELRAIE
jgi:hypothetical protein